MLQGVRSQGRKKCFGIPIRPRGHWAATACHWRRYAGSSAVWPITRRLRPWRSTCTSTGPDLWLTCGAPVIHPWSGSCGKQRPARCSLLATPKVATTSPCPLASLPRPLCSRSPQRLSAAPPLQPASLGARQSVRRQRQGGTPGAAGGGKGRLNFLYVSVTFPVPRSLRSQVILPSVSPAAWGAAFVAGATNVAPSCQPDSVMPSTSRWRLSCQHTS